MRTRAFVLPCLALTVLLLSFSAAAQRPPILVPERDDVLVERLPRGYAAVMPRATDHGAAPVPIERLLDTAGRTGDARLVARAEAALARIPDARSTSAILDARAYAAQYRHDFPTALALLDRAIRLDPRDANARLSRAQILLVQGKLDSARGECVALALGVDAERGLLCAAAVAVRRGDFDDAEQLLTTWLARPGRAPRERRHALVMRGELASRRGDSDADAWFRQALALDPQDVRSLAAYSRHLRNHGRNAEAVRLLATAPETDHLLLEHALAAHAAGLPEAGALTATLAQRHALARATGSPPDLRDEAELLLELRGDAAAALPLAQRNFRDQRDYEDVDLLRRASAAAHAPAAWNVVEQWARSQHLDLAPAGAAR